ncbi:hypothetical protein Q4Q35_16430 [Flavivirga aquimarina]|uniref:TonB-dependent receptor n=1 Tax=Flavivirga aquimarina TaxID=2027862 RepID=A0ABT8WED7_9FLAO|nr:hypothetical protein [Flavivirga aquimarina]MDO5971394.1 hypothetical protein [Flavivirga aquimarina]
MKYFKLRQVSCIFFAVASFSFLKAQELDPQKALSLARVKKDGKIHIIQVYKIEDSFIEGTNLSESFNFYPNNIFDLIEKLGYDEILMKISSGSNVKISSGDVLLPVDAITNTIAVATNYPEHKKKNV